MGLATLHPEHSILAGGRKEVPASHGGQCPREAIDISDLAKAGEDWAPFLASDFLTCCDVPWANAFEKLRTVGLPRVLAIGPENRFASIRQLRPDGGSGQ
jgi:hypothetical protein